MGLAGGGNEGDDNPNKGAILARSEGQKAPVGIRDGFIRSGRGPGLAWDRAPKQIRDEMAGGGGEGDELSDSYCLIHGHGGVERNKTT